MAPDAGAEQPAEGLELARPLSAEARPQQQRAPGQPDAEPAPARQAAQLEAEEAVELVILVTRLTTLTCLILAGLKVVVYLLTDLAVVKTSAIDSVGDLMVTPVTMYTSWKMSKADPGAYPAGPSTMAILGALVLSSIMAAVMFYNGVSNLAEIFIDQETSDVQAIKTFWASMFGAPCSVEESHMWEELRDGVRHMKNTGLFSMGDLSVLMRTLVVAPDFAAACSEAVDVVKDVEQSKAQESIWFSSLFAVFFLVCCLAYELAIYIYCVVSAIPKTGSEVLETLAADKRNDCVGLCFVIACLLARWWLEDELGEFWAEKMDPISSLVVSAATFVVWARFSSDQLGALMQGSADRHLLGEVSGLVEEIAGRDESLRVSRITMHRCSASRYVVRVELGVRDPSASCGGVQAAVQALSGLEHPAVARLLVCPRALDCGPRGEPRPEGEAWQLVDSPGARGR